MREIAFYGSIELGTKEGPAMELKKFDQAIQTVCKCTEQVLSENVRMLNRYRQYYADIGKYCKEKEVYLQTQEDFERI